MGVGGEQDATDQGLGESLKGGGTRPEMKQTGAKKVLAILRGREEGVGQGVHDATL